MTHVRHIVATALLLAGLTLIAVLYFAGHSFRVYLIENTDLLYLPTLFADIGSHGGRLSDWYLPPAPYVFPDFPIYLFPHVLGADTVHRLGLFAVAQPLATFGALWFLARPTFRSDALILAVTIITGLMWLAVNAGEPFVILLASVSHYGAFVAAMLFAALWLHFTSAHGRVRERVILCALCAVSYLSTLSDAFFIVQVIVPFVAATVLVALRGEVAPNRRVSTGVVAVWALLALVVPALIYRMPVPSPEVNVAWSPSVSDQLRVSLESRFHLTDGHDDGDHWGYRLADATPANVGALVRDPAVRDTYHIDRQSYAVDGAASPLWRAATMVPVGLVASTFAMLGLCFLGRVWSALHRGISLTHEGAILLAAGVGELGVLSYSQVVAHPTRYPFSLGLDKAYSNTSDLYAGVGRVIADTPLLGVIAIAYVGLVFLALSRGRNGANGSDYPRQLSWIAAFSLLSILATFLVASLLSLGAALPPPRYLIPAYSWPVVVVVLLLGQSLGRRTFVAGTTVSLLALAGLGSSAYALVLKEGLDQRAYSSEVACIDDALRREGLRHGIAQNWDAKYVQELSGLDLTIAQYRSNLEPFKQITSDKYFRETYDFAIISSGDGEHGYPRPGSYMISTDALSRVNGAPKRVIACGIRSVYIYGKDKLRVTPRD